MLASETLKLRFVRDRGQLFLDFQGAGQTETGHWYSADLLRRLVTGERLAPAELDPPYAAFLQSHIGDIEGLFGEGRLSETLQKLHQLERILDLLT